MTIGSYNGIVFETSDSRILTIGGLSGSAGSDWAVHDTVGGKARSQYIGPKLRTYTFDVTLSAMLGVKPRDTLNKLREIAENGTVGLLVIGNAPVSANPFKLTDLSESWDNVTNNGELVTCKVSLSLEEYV